MRAYGMRGTPTTLLWDRSGQLRMHQFGHVEDMRLGAAITGVLGDARVSAGAASTASAVVCGPEGCD